MKSNPLVSVIIVNWNGGETFENCLRSLKKVSYPNWELVVVDNASSDGSEKLPAEIGIKRSRLIKNKINGGFAPSCNQGLKESRGKYILLLNNDTKVISNFLSVTVSKMESDPTVGALQPKIKLMDNPRRLDNAGSYLTRIGFLEHWGFLDKDSAKFNQETEIFSAKGACLLIRREVVEKVGLFDPGFVSYFEESDFCWRVWLSGSRVLFYPRTYIYHKVGFTIKRLDVAQINYHYYKNRICSLIKNLSARNLLPILGAHLVVSLGISLVFLTKLKLRNALIITKAIWWNIGNIKLTLKKRREVQQIRVIPDRVLFDDLLHPINWRKYLRDFRRIEKDLS